MTDAQATCLLCMQFIMTTLSLQCTSAPELETRTRLSAPVAQTDPVPFEPVALLHVQQFGDHVGQPHRQQDGYHDQGNGELRLDDAQWEGPVHVDAEGGRQVTVAARGWWGETMGHCLYPENINTKMRVLDRYQDSRSHIYPLNSIHPESAFLLCILAGPLESPALYPGSITAWKWRGGRTTATDIHEASGQQDGQEGHPRRGARGWENSLRPLLEAGEGGGGDTSPR